ncbi:ABC transporter permease [Parageobacillus thermoglucosidasius]|uniref:ABC transporter permease subunit n=1 Tax=Parageobacillus thermoglucosidasius TaxID=1426 RepID=A0AB38QY53_PARTM|nr:ABC transporter permease subunit [Parageobacillus thermoglucosidasius]UOE76537.1 ABC transporter permease subunit [Parageobacillus thermoglucosidasius]
MRNFLKQYYVTILIGIAGIAVWELITRYGNLNPVIFPTLSKVFRVFTQNIEELLLGLVSSLRLLIPAYIGSIILGIGGGLLLGLHHRVRHVLMPYVHLLSPLPPTLFVPYAIAVLPTFESASIFLIFIGTFWHIFLGTLHGVLIIEKQYLDNAKTLGLKGNDLLFKVIIPAASPHILSGAGSALTMSFLILTMAEMFGAKSGMGYFIQYYTDFAQYDYVIAGIIFNSAVILIALLLFEKLKKRLLFWTNLKEDTD